MLVSRPHPRSPRKPVPSSGPFLRSRREIQAADFHDAAVSAVRFSPYAISCAEPRDKACLMRLLPALIAAAALAGWAGASFAQSPPNRPMRLVVPLAPGGTNDTLGRIVADPLAERLGQQLVVDNRPGGNSQIGSAIVARAVPDGRTLLIMGAGHAINPSAAEESPLRHRARFRAGGLVGGGPYLLVIPPSVAAQTAKEFVAWVKARAGKVSYASAGVGNPTHLAGELFKSAGPHRHAARPVQGRQRGAARPARRTRFDVLLVDHDLAGPHRRPAGCVRSG